MRNQTGWGSLGATADHFLKGACAALAAAALILASGCGGSGGSPSASASGEIAGATTQAYSVKVIVPDGINLTADKLKLTTSASAVTPSASGAATISAYTNGSQLAILLTPSGNPMLMGWIDAQHTEVSAATTAQVLGYFALGGPIMLNDTGRNAMIAALPTAQGIGTVEAAITNALKANLEAFASGSPDVDKSVQDFVAPLYAAAKASASAMRTAQVQAMTIDPAQEKSGIDVISDPPFGVHLMNGYRRRAYAFIDRISHTNVDGSGNSTVVDDSNSTTRRVAQFEIAPTTGLSGGLGGTLADIMTTMVGGQPTAYADVSSPVDKNGNLAPVSPPVVDGSTKTNFQLTVVGPGGQATSVVMTDEQKLAQINVSISGNIQDYLMPFISNVILGSGIIKVNVENKALLQFLADMTQSLLADLINFAADSQDLQTAFLTGDTKTVYYIIGTSNQLQTMLSKAFQYASSKCTSCAGPNTPNAQAFLNAFFSVVNLTGGILELGDAAARDYQISALSAQADQWTLVSTASKVALNPSTASVNSSVPTATLTATVLGVENAAGFSYHWTTTTNFGDLTEIGGNNRTSQTDYCSASNQALFVYNPSSGYHDDGTVDTVDVQAYLGTACDPSKGGVLGEVVATITYQQKIYYQYSTTISPLAQTFTGGGTVTFTAQTTSLNGGPVPPVGSTYRWHIIGNGANPWNDSTDTYQGASDTVAANTTAPTWTTTFPNMNIAIVKYTVWVEVIDQDGVSQSYFSDNPFSQSKITLISSTCPLADGYPETTCY